MRETPAQQARYLRAALKAAYPRARFTVRTTGATIVVRTNAIDDVTAFTQRYVGGPVESITVEQVA